MEGRPCEEPFPARLCSRPWGLDDRPKVAPAHRPDRGLGGFDARGCRGWNTFLLSAAQGTNVARLSATCTDPFSEKLVKLIRVAVPIMIVLCAALGCSDDDPAGPDTGITIGDLVGSWIATSDTHTSNVDAAQTFDIVAAGGEVRVTVLANGGARTWVDFGTFQDEWDSAISIAGTTLTADPVEPGRTTRVWEITLANGVLTMTDANAEFDFTLSGATPSSSTEVVVLVRN
jgi:hypothetical protein